MKDIGMVQGSSTQAVPIVVNKDTVYIHTDIIEIEDGLFEYYEIQYDKNEYITIMAKNGVRLMEQATSTDDAINIILTEFIPMLMG